MTEPDDYERRYMGAAEAIAVSRARLGRGWHLFFVASVIASVLTVALGLLVPGIQRLVWLGGFSALVMTALWLTSMVVRVVVTRREIRIQHGLFGPSIALDDVVDVRAERHGFMRFVLGIGWGVGGKSLDGSYLYSTLGVPRGVVIRYRRGKKIAKAFVSSTDPEALVAAIEQAGREEQRIRVDPVAEASREADAADDEETAVDLDQGKISRSL